MVAGSPRPLNRPKPVHVRIGRSGDVDAVPAGADRTAGDGAPAVTEGVPAVVEGERVEYVRESWLVEDRWWTSRPVRRRYWEVVSASGRNLVVFHDLRSGRWFTQSA